ncbi:uncharacterized protein [Clytia hemisphaerica]|uniref:Uncharacterized protein n=1 Tax=Clytia hemisphaerica TaxID=252671 RepID=A0A7M5VFP8_9CNID|eukprot:TCONS_00002524-protein
MESLQRSPEELLSETLQDLVKSYEGLKQNLNGYTQAVRYLKTNDFNNEDEKHENYLVIFQADSKNTLRDFIGCFKELTSLIEIFQDFFGVYQVDFEYWCKNEYQLQTVSEDFYSDGEKIVHNLETVYNRLRKLAEEAGKKNAETREQESRLAEQNSNLKTRRNEGTKVSCRCVLLWLPRLLSRRCHQSSRQNSSSYENLVLEKERQNKITEANSTADVFIENIHSIVTVSSMLITSVNSVTNGMSYLHQDLCRLDYLDANKEKHFEIVNEHGENLLKLLTSAYSWITIANNELGNI